MSTFPLECISLIREFVYGIYFINKLPRNTQSTLSTGFITNNGELHGVHRVYYHNGKIKNMFIYEYGVLNTQLKMSRLGHKSYEFEYIMCRNSEIHDDKRRIINKSVMHGKQVKWYNTGQLCKISNYNFGKQHGKELCWSLNGQLITESDYLNGVCICTLRIE